MTSIRQRLGLALILSTTLVWAAAMGWINLATRDRVEQALDARLSEAARMVSSLLSDHRIDLARGAGPALQAQLQPAGGYERLLSCQIWSVKGEMVGRSEGAPQAALTAAAAGFSDSIVDGERWRVYTAVNAELGVRVMVGDRVAMRDNLVRGVITGLAVPALIMLPLLAALILAIVQRGLAPLTAVAGALEGRATHELRNLDVPRTRELRPVVTALNALIARIRRDRQRERAFTTYAAHELKTPLAGISAQAQIALHAPDEQTRRAALQQILASVGRTDRLVGQLLELAALEDEDMPVTLAAIDLGGVVAAVAADLAPLAEARNLRLVVAPAEGAAMTRAAPELVFAALRNPVENAILVSPPGATVGIDLWRQADEWRVEISDQGPGLEVEDAARLTQPFYRGRGAAYAGSGLGLAITQAALERVGGRLSVGQGAAQGATVVIALPAEDAPAAIGAGPGGARPAAT